MNALKRLQDFGQSVYVDEIRRSWLDGDHLRTLIERDGLRGVTSNPAIFQKAIAESNDYDEAIRTLAREGASVEAVYEALVIDDIQRAADLFADTYDASDGRFGYVSLEVDPHLANDTRGTVEEARHLWARLRRDNVFIKVPGTREGLAAIETLIDEGINVNVTLLFGLGRYREVAEAYLRGLEKRAERGDPLERVASVASFFLSRIDVMVDPMLEAKIDAGGEAAETARDLRGQVALASAKGAYRIYKEIFGGERFAALAAEGARPQRLLWASTSTKNPEYSDTLYVEALIGPDTINTMPTDTLDAYRDHGDPAERLEDGVDEAVRRLDALAALGIDLDGITRDLEVEGAAKFVKPFDSLMDTLRDAVGKAPA